MMRAHILIKVRNLDFLGVALRRLGKNSEAILMFDRAIEINPNNESTYINKGKKFRFFRSCSKMVRKIF